MSQKKNVFEEVDAPSKTPSQTPLGASQDMGWLRSLFSPEKDAARGYFFMRSWLLKLFVFVGLMVLIGGLTRLTDSGLSIPQWAVLSGALPPLSDEMWQQAFTAYQATPEFQLQNNQMDLAAFKVIYWWEWGHRFLGRLVGVVWAVGFLFLWAGGYLPRGWAKRLWLIGLLGGLQGFLGWWMVRSGLSGTALNVAPYRLAVHLGMAFVILAVIGWYLLSLKRGAQEMFPARRLRKTSLCRRANVMLALVFVQVCFGALVAGLDGGQGFIDWPLMEGQIIPATLFEMQPFWQNFILNIATTQFFHRLFAYGLLGFAVFMWWTNRRGSFAAVGRSFTLLLVGLVLQAVLGIVTLRAASPLPLAFAHQFGAMIIWMLALIARFECFYPRTQKLTA